MQVSLVKPTLGQHPDGPFVDEGRMEPLNLGVLAGLTPAGVDVRLWDDRVDEIDYDEPTDLVAITVEAFTARRAYQIADEYRARAIPVVMGGIHATALPDEVAEHAAGFDRNELVRVAKQHDVGAGADGGEEVAHEFHVDHGRFVDHD